MQTLRLFSILLTGPAIARLFQPMRRNGRPSAGSPDTSKRARGQRGFLNDAATAFTRFASR